MRDPAREPADRLQPLRLPQLRLEPIVLLLSSLSVRDIEQEALREERPPLLVLDDRRLVSHPDDAPVACDEPVVAAERLAAGVRNLGGGEDTVSVVGMQD